MGSLEDAMKKAGLAASEEVEAPAKENAETSEAKPAREPRSPERPQRVQAAAEPLVEKPCAKCSTPFMPKHAKHRLCPKCAEEQFNAAKERAASGAGAEKGEKGVGTPGTNAAGPRPERRERPPRPPRPLQEGRREGPREPREQPREHREPQKEAPQGFPRDYLQSGYFAGTVLRDEFFDTWARHVAGLLVSRGLSTNQIRAFYGHVRRAEASEKAGRDFQEVREEVLKMRPVAAARQGRKLIPAEFADFLDRNLDHVKDARTLHAFVEHFQAVVGYTAGRLKK